MQIGMAITVPQTKKEKQRLRSLAVKLVLAADSAKGLGLTIQGHPGEEFLVSLAQQLSRTATEC